jgi:hypothetical protein
MDQKKDPEAKPFKGVRKEPWLAGKLIATGRAGQKS